MTKKKEDLYKIQTSAGSVRKYPNVIWFPRSKTDPREIREVLKLALKTQEENSEGFFNDKLLGVKMARIGSISVVGLNGEEYIESYKAKGTGDVSFITNARMLMRLFRFLGLVTRISKGKYILTDLGRLYAGFSGDFPSYINGLSEEKVLLDCLANFIFYSVGDDSSYRDSKFRIRPFLWLLHNIEIEPQCIYQLIVTAFATQSESLSEYKRIINILRNLRNGKTTLKDEWKKLGLDANDYSCVHNFYDSVKILVYLGISLGLISKTSNPTYGKKIAGRARNLKQATVFYTITKKGHIFLTENLSNKLVYYDEIYNIFGDKFVLSVCIILASLNYHSGMITVDNIHRDCYSDIPNLDNLLVSIKTKMGINIVNNKGYLSLEKPISFSFFQHIPPEIMATEKMTNFYKTFMKEIKKGEKVKITELISTPSSSREHLAPYFQIDEARRYNIPIRGISELKKVVLYPDMEEVYGGKDRFSGRVSPTNSVILSDGALYVDQKNDALDFLVAFRLRDPLLSEFINQNINPLIDFFVEKSDIWEKDQHYTWVRNVFRHFGMEALYSGSAGMLSRADVSVLDPFIGGIEAKSPRENRGTLNTKAVRQAVDAKIQVADKIADGKKLPKIAIAIGRRISDHAINEEQKWAKERQPVFLINDVVLHYLVLKSATVNFSQKSLIDFFTKNHGPVNSSMVKKLVEENTSDKEILQKTDEELKYLTKYFGVGHEED